MNSSGFQLVFDYHCSELTVQNFQQNIKERCPETRGMEFGGLGLKNMRTSVLMLEVQSIEKKSYQLLAINFSDVRFGSCSFELAVLKKYHILLNYLLKYLKPGNIIGIYGAVMFNWKPTKLSWDINSDDEKIFILRQSPMSTPMKDSQIKFLKHNGILPIDFPRATLVANSVTENIAPTEDFLPCKVGDHQETTPTPMKDQDKSKKATRSEQTFQRPAQTIPNPPGLNGLAEAPEITAELRSARADKAAEGRIPSSPSTPKVARKQAKPDKSGKSRDKAAKNNHEKNEECRAANEFSDKSEGSSAVNSIKSNRERDQDYRYSTLGEILDSCAKKDTVHFFAVVEDVVEEIHPIGRDASRWGANFQTTVTIVDDSSAASYKTTFFVDYYGKIEADLVPLHRGSVIRVHRAVANRRSDGNIYFKVWNGWSLMRLDPDGRFESTAIKPTLPTDEHWSWVRRLSRWHRRMTRGYSVTPPPVKRRLLNVAEHRLGSPDTVRPNERYPAPASTSEPTSESAVVNVEDESVVSAVQTLDIPLVKLEEIDAVGQYRIEVKIINVARGKLKYSLVVTDGTFSPLVQREPPRLGMRTGYGQIQLSCLLSTPNVERVFDNVIIRVSVDAVRAGRITVFNVIGGIEIVSEPKLFPEAQSSLRSVEVTDSVEVINFAEEANSARINESPSRSVDQQVPVRTEALGLSPHDPVCRPVAELAPVARGDSISSQEVVPILPILIAVDPLPPNEVCDNIRQERPEGQQRIAPTPNRQETVSGSLGVEKQGTEPDSVVRSDPKNGKSGSRPTRVEQANGPDSATDAASIRARLASTVTSKASGSNATPASAPTVNDYTAETEPRTPVSRHDKALKHASGNEPSASSPASANLLYAADKGIAPVQHCRSLRVVIPRLEYILWRSQRLAIDGELRQVVSLKRNRTSVTNKPCEVRESSSDSDSHLAPKRRWQSSEKRSRGENVVSSQGETQQQVRKDSSSFSSKMKCGPSIYYRVENDSTSATTRRLPSHSRDEVAIAASEDSSEESDPLPVGLLCEENISVTSHVSSSIPDLAAEVTLSFDSHPVVNFDYDSHGPALRSYDSHPLRRSDRLSQRRLEPGPHRNRRTTNRSQSVSPSTSRSGMTDFTYSSADRLRPRRKHDFSLQIIEEDDFTLSLDSDQAEPNSSPQPCSPGSSVGTPGLNARRSLFRALEGTPMVTVGVLKDAEVPSDRQDKEENDVDEALRVKEQVEMEDRGDEFLPSSGNQGTKSNEVKTPERLGSRDKLASLSSSDSDNEESENVKERMCIIVSGLRRNCYGSIDKCVEKAAEEMEKKNRYKVKYIEAAKEAASQAAHQDSQLEFFSAQSDV